VKRARGSLLLARSNPVLGGLPSVPDSFHHQDKNLMHFVRLGIFFFALSTGLIRYQILMLCYLIWMLITYMQGVVLALVVIL